MGLFGKIFGDGGGGDAANDKGQVERFFADVQSNFSLAGAETDFANPDAWSQQAYIKFLAKGQTSQGPFTVAYHEKSSAPGGLLPGHWLGLHLDYRGTSLGSPSVFMGLGEFNSTNQQLLWRPHAEVFRGFFFHLIQAQEPQYAPAAAVNITRLSKLAWGEGAASEHQGKPPS